MIVRTAIAAARRRAAALAWLTRFRLLAPVLSLCAVAAAPLRAQLPASALTVHAAAGAHVWWRSADAPVHWTAAHPAIAAAVRWRVLQPGLETGRLDLSGDGIAWKISVVLVRLDAARFAIALDTAAGGWTLERAGDAALAVNAGQFANGTPWGWLVRDGVELQPPGSGPLSAALVSYTDGSVDILEPHEIPAARAGGRVLQAFQSYPAVLMGDGVVPEPLRARGRGVDVAHRDSRLAVCVLRDRRLLFALTRFTSPDSPLARLPFGPTTPEMAALLGGLGCRRAMLLDGGLSAQMAVRGTRGAPQRWPGLRAVPLGLIALRR